MNKLTVYYLVLAAILVTKTVSTIYDRSVVIHHGGTVLELQQEKLELTQKETALLAQLSQLNSLAVVRDSEALVNYQPITKPLVVSGQALTASQF